MLSHLQDYAITIKALIQEHKFLIEQINDVVGKTLARIIIKHIHKVLELQRKESFKTKNKKLNYLIKANIKPVMYKVLILHLSAHQLTLTEIKLGL